MSADADTKQQLYEYTRQGLLALVQMLPSVLWSGLKNAISGFLLMGFFGAVMAGGFAMFHSMNDTNLPAWLILSSLVVVPLSLALAGGFSGGVRGLLAMIAKQLIERNLIDYLYAFVRPVLVRSARRLAEHTGPVTKSEVAKTLKRVAKERTGEALKDDAEPRSFIERLERRIALRLQTFLIIAALQPGTTTADREATIADLENTGLETIEETIADTIIGLYTTQLVIAYGVAVGVSAIPYVVFFAV